MERYNGWANYETWVCNLWIDETGYNIHLQEIGKEYDAYNLSKVIEDYFELQLEDLELQSGFFMDILNSAMRTVNFYEIAKHYAEGE